MKAMNYHGNRFKTISHQPNYKLGIRNTPVVHVNNSKWTTGRAVNHVQVIPIYLDKDGKMCDEYYATKVLYKHILHY